ncbi:MAG: tellurite resistance TerB family protein [Pseudomonadota bacterium]
MSMMGTLAKVALGVALAKGASALMSRGGTGQGGVLGAAPSGGAGGTGGGIENMLGSLLSGGGPSGQGGLGGLMDALGGGARGGASGGGLNDILGGLMGGALPGGQSGGQSGGLGGAQSGGQGGIGDMLGSLLGGGAAGMLGGAAAAGAAQSPFADVLNQALARGGEPEVQPAPEQEAAAALMLRAMIQAAMADGDFGPAEQQAVIGRLGDVSAEERAFVEHEMAQPVDPAGLARQVPRGMEEQVYAMAVMGIRIDDRREVQFLRDLAQGMGLDQGAIDRVHDGLGVARLT